MAKRIIGRHKAFLTAFAKCGSITKAARAAGVDRGQHYEWLDKLKGYREDFEEATRQAADLLEEEARRRAEKGVFEPNVYKGEFVYPVKGYHPNPETGLPDPNLPIYGKKPLGVQKYSDALLMFLLRGLRPDRYRDRTELTGKDGGPIEGKLEIVFVKAKKRDDGGNEGGNEGGVPGSSSPAV